ncbi:MAG: epimerase [Bacteroidota bacterium]|nr:epimerase [Odoribacter sp.]MDP3644472.1 epimerase [Bacteroidota bacterium]
MRKLKVIITGATGMIGEGVLYECLHHPEVEKVLVITRNSCGYVHPKLTEIIHNDFFNFSSLNDRLAGYNACYFCLGVTSLGKNETEYTKLTYTLTLNFATALASLNPDMIFCYISGAGTDSSEKGRTMWARVKGKTENDLMKLPFRKVYNFRPGGIEPFLPLKPTQTYYKTYKYLKWLIAIIKVIAPNAVITLKDLAAAMINVSLTGYPKNILEMKDMKVLMVERNKLIDLEIKFQNKIHAESI